MKTYEQTISDLFARKAEYDKQMKKRKKFTSAVAAVAAALILFTALPVGAVIISRQAKQPAEIPAPEQTSTVSLDTISKETVEMHETILETEKDPATSSYIPGEPILPDCMEIHFGFEKYDTNENGTTHYFDCFLTSFSNNDYVGFQVNMTSPEGIVFDCGPVFFNTDMSDYGLSELPINQRHHRKEIGFFIPNDVDYGEIHIYLNLLFEEGETVTDFASDPYIQRCFSFAKFGGQFIITNIGIENPTRSKEDMLQGAAAAYEDTIYWAVNSLLALNFADEDFSLIDDKDDPRDLPEDTLLSKHWCIEVIEKYRIDHEERFQEILRQVITDRENEKRKIREYFEEHGEDVSSEPLTRNDPLEDIAK